MLIFNLILYLCIPTGAFTTSWIVPGAVWKDTSGNKIDAHGGGIVQRGSTFYWVGQSNGNGVKPAMYSSTDLLNWEYLGLQSTVSSFYRPKFAKPNGSFWIYGQVNRLVQPLKSSAMVGGYEKYGAGENLPPNDYTYSDTGMFQNVDGDGSYYILTSADHNQVQVNLVDDDGTIGDRVNKLADGAYEAPGLFTVDGIYFLIVSGKTGYTSNPNKMFHATSLTGSWTGPFDIAPENENTYNSQNTFELTIKGSKQTTYIYMGDQWAAGGTVASNYVWLPMNVDTSAKTVTLEYHAMWKIDVTTGVVSYPSTKKRYEAEHANLSGRSAITDCDHCITKRAVHQICSDSEVTFTNVTGTGKPQWISFHYNVNEYTAGEVYIVVNDYLFNISSLNSNAGYHRKTPVELELNHGDVNTIKFGAYGSSGFEVVLDGIELFEEDL